jgi:PAS domain S-box-containing protein
VARNVLEREGDAPRLSLLGQRHQRSEPGRVDERQRLEIEHEAAGCVGEDRVDLRFELGRGGQVDLAADLDGPSAVAGRADDLAHEAPVHPEVSHLPRTTFALVIVGDAAAYGLSGMARAFPPHWLIGVETRLLDRIRAAVMVTSLDGTVLYANPYCETLYGRSPEELEGSASGDFAAEPLDERTISDIGSALLSGQSWEGDFRVVRKDGVIIEVHAVNSPLFGDSGTVAGVVSIAFDITRRVETELQLSEQEAAQRFLAESSTLLATSLSFPESFELLARLSVPFLGDVCVVDVADGLAIRRVAAVHADEACQPLVDRLGKEFSPAPAGPHPAASVVRGGRAEFSADMSDELLRSITRNEEHYNVVRALEFTSYMCVPLTARGRILGAMTLVSAGSGRRYTAEDLALAEEFARRAALVLDNARLYSERDHVARALQASLLPPSLPEIPGVEIAARYVAAGEGNEVGGDFYDVFQARRNSWCFTIGDVAGKGPEAAAVAGLARHTLRAAALHARRPKQMLRTLHEALMRDEASADRFCTVCCGLLRRADAGVELALSCAGHPLPILARSAGGVETIDCRGTLVGLADPVRLQDQAVQLAPGDVAVLYTDGATEAHRRPDDLFGEERLAQVIGESVARTADEIADRILSAVVAFGPPEPRDDIAILVLKVDADATIADPVASPGWVAV